MEKILKLEMSDLYRIFMKNPSLHFEIELKEDLFQKCTEADIINQVKKNLVEKV